jgi:Tol biopolymer transport system component
MNRLLILSPWLIGILIPGNVLVSAEIKGRVVEVKDDIVHLATDSEYLPAIGDPVEIYFVVPGLDDSVQVATGRVTQIDANLVRAKIDRVIGTLGKNQLARITSERPQTKATQKGFADPSGVAPPTEAPTGSLVCSAIRSGHSEIILLNADGAGVRELTSRETMSTFPAWSPDGKQIVFCSSGDDGGGLFVMDADGRNVRQLTNGADVEPAWSPDGSKIAFTRYSQGGDNLTQILAVSAAGGNPVSLTDGSAIDADPAWSPDGKKIAFGSARDPRIPAIALTVMDADGTNDRELLRLSGAAQLGAAWSPDGTRIAYAGVSQQGQLNLFVVGADGTGKIQLTKHDDANTIERYPAWSPNGQHIAYQSVDLVRSMASLSLINVDGTGKRVLLKDEIAIQGGRPAWKPDVAKLLPRRQERLVFQDDFETPSLRAVPLFSEQVLSVRHINGEAWLSGKSAGVLPILYPELKLRDFIAEFEFRVPLATDDSGYGLIFRSAPVVDGGLRHYYMFSIQPKAQTAGLACWQNPNWTLAQTYALPPNVLSSTNHVRLEAVAHHFRLFVNKTLVGELTDRSLEAPGLVGLCVSAATANPGTAYFGRLRVYAPDPGEIQPTP